MRESILIVDDDEDLAEFIKMTLLREGFRVRHLDNVDAAFDYLKQEGVDLLLLDIQLPGISGIKFLEILKQYPKTASLPIIMITVLNDEYHKVKGLTDGADDYIVKPFSARELLARVQALLRRVRNSGSVESVLQDGGLSLDLNRQQVVLNGKRIHLTETEFNILQLMMQRKGFVFSYEFLCERLAGDPKIMTSSNLHTHVKNLRRKLKSFGDRIETVYGKGYRLAE